MDLISRVQEPAQVPLEVLVAEDEAAIREDVAFALRDAGYRVTEAGDGAEASRLSEERLFDVAILDVRLPKVDGFSLLKRIHQKTPATTIVLMTAHASIPDAVAALKEGAFDFVTKPFDSEEFTLRVMGRAAERALLCRELESARRAASASDLEGVVGRALIGRSPAILRVLEQVELVAQTDSPVLLSGESGTGKELVARLLHTRSARRNRPFVAVNCAALPEQLLEAELFGHERGAFTGAERKREGRFKAAEGGTLLLDEVSEVPLSAQAKLLRVLQESTVEPLGSNATVSVDVRIISASNQNLKELVARRLFREDLYYRLNVLDVALPPLRERRGDLPALIEHFLRRFVPPTQATPGISPRAWVALSEHPFPGNVRELEHAIERAVVLARGQREIDLPHLPPDIAGRLSERELSEPKVFRKLAEAVQAFERQHLNLALQMSSGKRSEAARILGISRKSLWQKLKSYGLSSPSTGPGAEPSRGTHPNPPSED